MTNQAVQFNAGVVGVTGRFQAIVHTGHIFDANGEFVGYKSIKQQSALSKNTIVLRGFNSFLSLIGSNNGTWRMSCVAGTGNTAPNESNTTLAAYAGVCSTWTTYARTFNTNTAALPLFWRHTFRFTFNSGAFGAGSVNLAEAGIAQVTNDLSEANGSTPLLARGLLVDGGGSPTTVTVSPSDILDIVYELTFNLPYDATGSVTINIDGTPTSISYTVRPALLSNGGSFAWTEARGVFGSSPPTSEAVLLSFIGSAPETSTIWGRGTGASNGVLQGVTTVPTNTGGGDVEYTTGSFSTYVTDSKQRDLNASWGLTKANATGGINVFLVDFGNFMFQVSLGTALNKISTKQLDMTFRIAFANAP